ncbi:PEP-CTERM putative exosortase interaction domain protein [Coleofasciculus chthonoplastes PCC 7420]|uniref:PEP-CTERM putative exosortase interaction domain protein n=1 Tax=Coleofasciculus chthonoplastes PCC 7420 TaxID=118168 RepID=B4VM40_9CYAN|nr:PEP-CTERM sorting domain-containing protein [Coleofasciculus chthonoplastes]EDX76701.1 PEP-CTERM putative exosortase interaction domain protein [Coleofasciculus chthonoplastes PCC 7420]
MKKIVRVLQQIAVASVAVVAANSAEAAIIGSSVRGGYVGQPETNLELQIVDPPPQEIRIINFEREEGDDRINPDPNRDLRAVIEKQALVLPRNLDVLDEFGEETFRPNTTIAKDTLVSSYLFYVNPAGVGQPKFRWHGQIRFDAPVLGILGGFSINWNASNRLLGLENTSYSIGSGLDRRQGDIVNIDNNVLQFDITASAGMEPFRVITSGSPTVSVPEPITILGSGVALGFGVLFRKIKQKQ